MTKQTPKLISSRLLRHLGACPDQVALFIDTFPRGHEKGVVVSLRNVEQARKAGLDIDWLAQRILPAAGLDEYYKVRATTSAECAKVIDAVWAEYMKDDDAVWAKCEKLNDAARDKRKRVRAVAFVRLATKKR